MKHDRDTDSVRWIAKRALDRDGLAELLDRVEDTDYDPDAIEALEEVVAELTVLLAGHAAQRARHRGRLIQADDIAHVYEDAGGCCGCGGPPFTVTPLPVTVWES